MASFQEFFRHSGFLSTYALELINSSEIASSEDSIAIISQAQDLDESNALEEIELIESEGEPENLIPLSNLEDEEKLAA